MLTPRNAKILKAIEYEPHYTQDGRVWQLKVNGARRYVKSALVAVMIANGLLNINPENRRLYLTSWGNILLQEYNDDA